jgi:hypothetical protein
LVITRSIQGICNGNIGTVSFQMLQGLFLMVNTGVTKVVYAEITDSSNVPKVFALLPLMWATGKSD